MTVEELLTPANAPAAYFMRQTATLRARVDALTLALLEARALLEDGDATPEDADRIHAIINRTLEANQ